MAVSTRKGTLELYAWTPTSLEPIITGDAKLGEKEKEKDSHAKYKLENYMDKDNTLARAWVRLCRARCQLCIIHITNKFVIYDK